MCLTGCTPSNNPASDPDAGAPACNPVMQNCPCCCVLSIHQLTFSGAGFHRINKDTQGDFPAPEWDDGRAAADQSPVSYVRNTPIAFTAAFSVTTPACRAGETVQLKAKATLGGIPMEWTGSVTVNPGDAAVSASPGDRPLPNAVGIFESSDISWQTNRCNAWMDGSRHNS
jgi:hypothetical protein